MKNIEFYPSSKLAELVVPEPKPASKYIPEWYKNIKIFGREKPKFENGVIVNSTVKACVPFFDAYNSGYIQESWTDIQFSFDEKTQTFDYHFASQPQPFIHRKVSIKLLDVFMPQEFAWQFQWMPKLEKGYSMLITQPFNRLDLPFVNTSGIVDSDDFFHTDPGNYPFYFYKSFSGVIPKGTPLYQMIPIKRDSWNSSRKEFNEEDHIKRSIFSTSTFIGNYKKFFHKKKIYR